MKPKSFLYLFVVGLVIAALFYQEKIEQIIDEKIRPIIVGDKSNSSEEGNVENNELEFEINLSVIKHDDVVVSVSQILDSNVKQFQEINDSTLVEMLNLHENNLIQQEIVHLSEIDSLCFESNFSHDIKKIIIKIN